MPLSEGTRYISHIAILTAAHYGYQWVLPHDPAALAPGPADLAALKITLAWTVGFWLCIVWPAILFCEYLDRFGSIRYKKLPPTTQQLELGKAEPSFETQLPVVIRNQVIAIVFACVGAVWIHQNIRPFHRAEAESPLRTWLTGLLYLATADLVFYTGHVAMHRYPALRKYHSLHHTSLALKGLAGYYMDIPDFVIEHCPIFCAFFVWGQLGPAWAATIAAGAWNVILSHSGYDFPFGPDPRQHYLHHAKYTCNYGIFLDKVLDTNLAEKHADPLMSAPPAPSKPDGAGAGGAVPGTAAATAPAAAPVRRRRPVQPRLRAS